MEHFKVKINFVLFSIQELTEHELQFVSLVLLLKIFTNLLRVTDKETPVLMVLIPYKVVIPKACQQVQLHLLFRLLSSN